MDSFGFRDLRVYQTSRDLVKTIYSVLAAYPSNEQYALCDQLRRASVSVPSNIAEGMSRSSDKEKAHFIEISYGSLMEVLCQMEISKELNYVTEEQMKDIENQITIIAKQLSKLRTTLSNSSLNSKP
ncbi:MAG: four helix bundle protein [Bacteroidaceae bacterium]|jgi:four helix bundle protein|nr:four helix bundle protein [Bacteroidaceae bacterium]